ncbi:hypothetical protein [Halochromatium salexigens]|uniref:hypothetical protein n=1 Tax=Halochromatium salexigens TaxID=49447 RepID=UPI001912A818|nr:hypothetical protein [Halochromatium salexigens]
MRAILAWPRYAWHVAPNLTAYDDNGEVIAEIDLLALDDQVGRFAYRKGLFVLAQSGQAIEIRNDARFQPRTW